MIDTGTLYKMHSRAYDDTIPISQRRLLMVCVKMRKEPDRRKGCINE